MIARDELLSYLRRQRWFAGGDTAAEIVDVELLGWITHPDDGLGVRFALVTVAGPQGSQVYNVPLACRPDPVEENAYGLIGLGRDDADGTDDADLFVYDALHDPQARQVLMRGFFTDAEPPSDIQYVRRTDFGPDQDASIGPASESVVLGVEQSNTSFVIDETAILKVFRKVVAGRNPDIEVHDALAGAGEEHIAALWGWITAPEQASGTRDTNQTRHADQTRYDLAMLQRFLRTASNGWDSARASVRDLVAEPGVVPDEAGGDFAGEAERLGETVAAVHALMAERLDRTTWSPDDLDQLATRLASRLDHLLDREPTLEPYAATARARYAELRDLSVPVQAQRVHGDLHLGQTLRTTAGWKLIDFEGEPAATLAERLALDSPLRDVAGMLRSFDYAAHSYLLQTGTTGDEAAAQADAWIERNHAAFLNGYWGGSDLRGRSSDVGALLAAYEIDKAAYELVYELDHRPSWSAIPARALDQLL